MRHQLTGFQISIAIHALVVLLILAVSGSFIAGKRVVVIDFDIEPGSGIRDGIADKAVCNSGTGSGTGGCGTSQPEVEVRAEAKADATQSRTVEGGGFSESSICSAETGEKDEQLEPMASVNVVQEQQTAGANAVSPGYGTSDPSGRPLSRHDGDSAGEGREQGSLSGGTEAGIGLSGTGGSVPGVEGSGSGTAEYSREAYNDILERIRKNLVYPKRALEMGWEGSVGLSSFHVSKDGRVKDVRVEKSSGKSVLDRSAIDFIRGLKFPKPTKDGYFKLPPIRFELKRNR
ncbi:MAG: energy transducer TonB [Pseudomonadota bacterium]